MALEILRQALKDKLAGAIIVSALLFLYIFWIATFYPELSDMGDVYAQILQNPTFKAFVGDEMFALTTFGGFMGVEVFSYMGLVIGAYVAFMTASFVAGEIEQKTSDLLLSLPVGRVSVIVSRFIALIPLVAIIMIAMLAGIYAGARYINESIHVEWYALAMLFLGAFTLAVGSMSLLISAVMSDGKKAALISIGVLLAMYLVENIGAIVTGIDWARNLSLFHYLKLNSIAVSHTISWNNMAILLAVTIAFLALAAIAFRQRDINVA